MSKLKITSPKDGYVKTSKGTVVVSGKADATILAVVGELCPIPGPGPVVKGTTFTYKLDSEAAGPPRFNRWVIAFLIPGAGTYRLTITGIEADLGTVQVDTEIKVSAQVLRPDLVPPLMATIGDPSPNDHVPADGYEPYGELFVNPMGSVIMTNTDTGTPNSPLVIVSDYQTYFYWRARFGLLPGGTYMLRAVDNQGNGQSVWPLYVP
jgi:hypothetical protein